MANNFLIWLSGLIVGLAVGWLWFRTAVAVSAARLETDRAARDSFAVLFNALAGDALKANGDAVVKLATAGIAEVVRPVKEQLERVRETEAQLKDGTEKLTKALWKPTGLGAWGELQLKHTVEAAGLDATHYQEQPTFQNGLRPDMVVSIPGGKALIIDAKFPQTAYQQAGEETDETLRSAKLRDHAKSVRAHVKALAERKYWDAVPGALDSVVMFLPHDGLLSAALEQDKALLRDAAAARILIATPTSLIGLLTAVQHGWHQEALAKTAHEIYALGRELYDRLGKMGAHLSDLRKGLQSAVDAYNRFIPSMESRLLPTARRFKDKLPEIGPDVPSADRIETQLREVQAAELSSELPDGGSRSGAASTGS